MTQRILVVLALSGPLAACNDWPGLGGDGGFSGGGATRLDDSSGRLGSSCGASGASCYPGLTCVTGLPGGMCSKACQSDGDCAGGTCVPTASFGAICFKVCTGDATCRSQYSCVSNGGANFCGPTPATPDGGL